MNTRDAARHESKCLDIPVFTFSSAEHLKFMRAAGPHFLLDGQAGREAANGKEEEPRSGRRAMAPSVGVGSSALSTDGDV